MNGVTDIGEVIVWGSMLSQTPLLSASIANPLHFRMSHHVNRVAAGQEHMCFITNTHQLFAVGANDKGQLGLGTGIPFIAEPRLVQDNVTNVACGWSHTIIGIK